MSTSTTGRSVATATTSLLTDHYELTMLDAALTSGRADRLVTFEAFARKLGAGHRYGVVCGVDRLVAAIATFRFADTDLMYLERTGVVSPRTLDHLTRWRFRGSVSGYRDGELYFPGSPLVTVDATFGDAVLLETIVLSLLNSGCAIAGTAADIVRAADGRTLIEMGTRRTNEHAAVEAARAAWIAGFTATSNLAAGQLYGVPTTGTAAHAWTLLHEDEEDAFTAQLDVLGVGTTLLVDTYSVERGLANALAAARRHGAAGPGAVRIDSGDLAALARLTRRFLDREGATATRIVLTSDLDAAAIRAIVAADVPVDAFGVGTQLVATPPAGAVYKLVAVEGPSGAMRPVAKTSHGKATIGGRKTAVRTLDADGRALAEVLAVGADVPTGRALQEVLLRDGESVISIDPITSTREARSRHQRALAELPDASSTSGPMLNTRHVTQKEVASC